MPHDTHRPGPTLRALLRSKQAGFTLIELMIAVAIVAILLAVALPSYRDSVRKSVRAEAQAYMMTVAARQQQFLVDTRGYAATLTAVGVAVPGNVDNGYTLSMPTPTTAPPAFTLTLTPKSSQAGERCGTLSIDAAGSKTAAVAGCW
jgi:type IV pilus assembly protein PilE